MAAFSYKKTATIRQYADYAVCKKLGSIYFSLIICFYRMIIAVTREPDYRKYRDKYNGGADPLPKRQ